MRLFKIGIKQPVQPAPTVAPVPKVLPVTKGSYVTINEAHYVIAVNGDEATVSVRDPATGEQRYVIYPVSKLKVCHAVSMSGDAKRTRLAPEQPAPSQSGEA